MHRKIIIALPDLPRRNEFAAAMQHALQATALINADWVLQRWARAEQLHAAGDVAGAKALIPKCCAKCNGTKYVPDSEMRDVEIGTSPVIFARGRASCGEIAACHTGHKIAEAVMGTLDPMVYGKLAPMPWNEAVSKFYTMFDSTPSDKGPGYFHVLCNDNGKIIDATAGMKR